MNAGNAKRRVLTWNIHLEAEEILLDGHIEAAFDDDGSAEVAHLPNLAILQKEKKLRCKRRLCSQRVTVAA
ncbi:MAG: hypothetical protein U5K38_16475 [Woeseiaceae bacterium]|nr:hypothetical protein [Woeseiaceae bacterium]